MDTKYAIFYQITSDLLLPCNRKLYIRTYHLKDKDSLIKFARSLDKVQLPGLNYIIRKLKADIDKIEFDNNIFTCAQIKEYNKRLEKEKGIEPKAPIMVSIDSLIMKENEDDINDVITDF